jgi:hypothetical protein
MEGAGGSIGLTLLQAGVPTTIYTYAQQAPRGTPKFSDTHPLRLNPTLIEEVASSTTIHKR